MSQSFEISLQQWQVDHIYGKKKKKNFFSVLYLHEHQLQIGRVGYVSVYGE